MSTLTSSSTLAEIKAAYYDNASYEEDGSTSKAAAFVTACRFLLLRIPRRSVAGGRGGEEFEFSVAEIKGEMTQARNWLAVHSRSGAVSHPDFSSFRS